MKLSESPVGNDAPTMPARPKRCVSQRGAHNRPLISTARSPRPADGQVGQPDGAPVVELIGHERQVDAELQSIEEREAADEIHAELTRHQLADERVAAAGDQRIVGVAEPQPGGEAEVGRDEGAVDAEVSLRGDRGMEALGVEGGRARLRRGDGRVRENDGGSGGDDDGAAAHAQRRRRAKARRRSARTTTTAPDEACVPSSAQPPPPASDSGAVRSGGATLRSSATGSPPSLVQPLTGAVAHWLATHAACRQASVGAAQSVAVLQQPAPPLEPKTQRLSVHAVAVWHAFDGVQSLVALQQGEAPAATKPHAPAAHTGAWQLLPAAQVVHDAPHAVTLSSATQTLLQSWKVAAQV